MNANALPSLSDFQSLSRLPNLSSVSLQHNLWRCDCELLPFARWIGANSQIVNGHGLVCDAPEDMDINDVLQLEC